MVVKGKEMGLSVLEEKQKSIGGVSAPCSKRRVFGCRRVWLLLPACWPRCLLGDHCHLLLLLPLPHSLLPLSLHSLHSPLGFGAWPAPTLLYLLSCPQLIAVDPNFLRISKGAYSLHCFHPDKEQVRRAPHTRTDQTSTCRQLQRAATRPSVRFNQQPAQQQICHLPRHLPPCHRAAGQGA